MRFNRMLQIVKKYLTNGEYRFLIHASLGWHDKMPDDLYLKKRFHAKLGTDLNLENPQSFNEKLQWLKLYDRNSAYTPMVDKYAVRDYISQKIGEEYLIPLVGGPWRSFEEIDFDALPDQFVLKCTHDSGGIVICKDKKTLNKKQAKRNIEKALKRNYFLPCREWPYKNVIPQIIAEKMMVDESGIELKDYKFMCFGGEIKCTFVCTDRFSTEGLHVTFFDREWNVMPFTRHYPAKKDGVPKPAAYERMIALAEVLSKDIPFVRVDFYDINGLVYFGELTFYPGSGFEEFTPEEWDYRLGQWIDLPPIKK